MGFVAATGAVLTLVGLGLGPPADPSMSGATTQLGMVAATLFGVSALLCAYRATVARDRMAGLIGVVLLAPGALFSWYAFVATTGTNELAARLATLTSATLAVVLLSRVLRAARWLEVFSGLGAVILALAASFVRADPGAASMSAGLALLVAMAGIATLYGLLVDIEVSEHRSRRALLQLERQWVAEAQNTDELLHDLRSGLLSIEAVSGTSDSDLAGPVRWEAARLRQLTTTREASRIEPFDLVAAVAGLVAARRAAGLAIELQAPATATVDGDRSELLAVVENLVANAERHGRPPVRVSVEVSVEGDQAVTRVVVADAGAGVAALDRDRIFRRGVSTHPDGSGLGLDRARELAERNQASVELAAGSGGGATFVLTLGSAATAGMGAA